MRIYPGTSSSLQLRVNKLKIKFIFFGTDGHGWPLFFALKNSVYSVFFLARMATDGHCF